MSETDFRFLDLMIDTGPELEKLRKRLGDLSDKAPDVLAKAVNTVARQVRRQITKDAQGEYTLREKGELGATKALPMKSATRRNLTATLTSKGPMLDLMKFLVAPQYVSRGTIRPDAYAAQVRTAGGMKRLDGEPKPFVTQFKSGHIAVAVRVPGKKMKNNPSRTFIKKLLSPAVPHMLGNERIRARAQELVDERLPAAVEQQVAKLLEKGVGT